VLLEGKTDDIKNVNFILGNPVLALKEVGRLDWCMKCEKKLTFNSEYLVRFLKPLL
jgi:hypothetical protein